MSYCTKCGSEFAEGATFCGSCGAPNQSSRTVQGGANATPNAASANGGVEPSLAESDSVPEADSDERFPKKYLVWAGILGMVSLVGIWFFWPGGSVEGIVATVEAPFVVVKGNTFTITATIENLLDSEQKLDSINIGDAYLEGVAVTGSSPSFSGTWHVPIDNTISHTFEIPIPARETLTVTFSVTALTLGDFEDAFNICVNGPTSCIFKRIRTLVE